MSTLESAPPPSASTRPYLIRALYEWCADNGLTPYIAVQADQTVQVPRQFVRDGQIVLNISADATSALMLGNDYVRFKARFDGVAREIIIPVDRVIAIYARENGQGMAFAPEPEPPGAQNDPAADPAPNPYASNPYLEAMSRSDSTSTAPSAPATPANPRSGIRLVAATPVESGSGADDHDQPPPSTPPRPALKRVK
jgi:stringent starvation protein B